MVGTVIVETLLFPRQPPPTTKGEPELSLLPIKIIFSYRMTFSSAMRTDQLPNQLPSYKPVMFHSHEMFDHLLKNAQTGQNIITRSTYRCQNCRQWKTRTLHLKGPTEKNVEYDSQLMYRCILKLLFQCCCRDFDNPRMFLPGKNQ
jgi:hypothetical protein